MTTNSNELTSIYNNEGYAKHELVLGLLKDKSLDINELIDYDRQRIDHLESVIWGLYEKIENQEERLKAQLALEIAGAFHVISGEAFETRSLKTKMEKLEKQIGYCLRQVRAAVENDPQNAYMKQVLEAISDLDSKIS